MKPSHKRMLYTFIIVVAVILLVPLLLLLYMTITDYRPKPRENLTVKANPPSTPSPDNVFTILTWNIGYFGLGKEMDFFYDGGSGVRPTKEIYQQYLSVGETILREHAGLDFYLLQEVDFRSKRTYYDDQFSRISGQFPGYGHTEVINYKVQFVPMPPARPMGKVLAGMTTFSRFHISESLRLAFVGDASWPAGLFMLDRCFILTRIPLKAGNDLVLLNTHNSAFDSGSRRKQQLAALKDIMMKEFDSGNYVVVGGDWNMNPVGYENLPFRNGDAAAAILPVIERDFLPEEWQWVWDPGLPSNRKVDRPYQPGITPTTIIDFFVVSPNIRVDTVFTADHGFLCSDHQPVIMSFRLNDNKAFPH